jgi:hypothetical protein
VVVMVAAGKQWLEPGRVAEVETLDEAQLGELVERPVDAREPDRVAFAAQAVEDLRGAEATFLTRQELDDGAP